MDTVWKPRSVPEEMPPPNEVLWHIHVDAEELDDTFDTHLIRDLGYEVDNFVGHRAIEEARESLTKLGLDLDVLKSGTPPTKHRTWKVTRSQTDARLKKQHANGFRTAYHGFLQHVTEHPDQFRGYVECENTHKWYLPSATHEFNDAIPTPFSLSLTSPEEAKASDVHISFPLQGTDPRLIARYHAMGMYVVCTPKEHEPDSIKNVVLTAQGSRSEIQKLVPLLWKDLQAVGGYGKNTKLMDEDIRKVHKFPQDAFMQNVIDQISTQTPS